MESVAAVSIITNSTLRSTMRPAIPGSRHSLRALRTATGNAGFGDSRICNVVSWGLPTASSVTWKSTRPWTPAAL